MPIIAVAVAAVSVAGVGAAGFGAILAGTASIGTMMAGVAAVGATLGAIGAVAGIDELKTAGMVLGGIGGIGAIANAVGAFGTGATMGSVFGGAEAAASATGNQAASLINGAVESSSMAQDMMSGFTQGGFSSSGIVDAANSIGDFSNTLMPMTKTMPGVDDMTRQALGGASDVLKPVTDNIMEGSMNSDNVPEVKTSAAMDPATAVTGKVADQPATADGGGFFGKGGFMQSMGGMGVIQAAGSFLSGAFDELKPAQAEAYKAQAAANNASAALQNKQNSNMNEPIPVARRVPVTGRIGGLMNSTAPAGAMV